MVMAMAISYHWLFLWDETHSNWWGDLLVLITDKWPCFCISFLQSPKVTPKWPQHKLLTEVTVRNWNPTPIDRSWDPATGHRPDFGGHGCGNSEMPTDESQPSNSSCSSKATETYLKFHHPTVFLVPTLYIILQYLVARRECFGALEPDIPFDFFDGASWSYELSFTTWYIYW